MLSEILIVCAIILAYFGIGFVFNKRRMSPFLGLEFFLIGLLFSLLKVDKNTFLPILPPFLGAFGLLMGIQVKVQDLKALKRDFYKKVFSYSLVVFTVLFLVFNWFFPYDISGVLASVFTLVSYKVAATFVPDRKREDREILFFTVLFLVFNWLYPYDISWVLASVFTLVSYKVAATFVPDRKREDREILFFTAFVPFLCILIYFLLNLASFSPSTTRWFFALLLIFSILSRLVFIIMENEDLIVLSVMGLVLFFSELAYIKGVSPFLTMFFLGFYLANYCKKGDKLFNVLIADEKQLYTIFLIFLGFVSGVEFNISTLKTALILTVAIVLVKYLYFIFRKETFVLYLSPGAFGVVLITDFWLLSGHKRGDAVFSIAVIIVILLQVFSMLFLKRVYGQKD